MTSTTFNQPKHKIHETLENSRHPAPVYPAQLEEETKVKYSDDVEIKEVEFREEDGRYDVKLTNNGLIEVCAVCGMSQPRNDAAMKLYDPQQVDEIEEYTWDNNRCEQRHKPYCAPWRDPQVKWDGGRA